MFGLNKCVFFSNAKTCVKDIIKTRDVCHTEFYFHYYEKENSMGNLMNSVSLISNSFVFGYANVYIFINYEVYVLNLCYRMECYEFI